MVRVVEVGPRDGLQNEPIPIPTGVKADYIFRIAEAGLEEIEATSFVSPKWVPQLGDAAELWTQLPVGPLYSALVPNLKGLDRALALGVNRIAVFTAASPSFVKRNINMSLDDSLALFADLVAAFRAAQPDGWVRGYISMAFECPDEGRIPASKVASVADRLIMMGCDEVSLGDTIGVAGPSEVKELAHALQDVMPKRQAAWHFHDTRGTAIANVAAALSMGHEAFDAAAGGMGGCPYAPGAGGNLATEDLVYFLHREGITTGIDLAKLAEASLPVLEHLGRTPRSRVQVAALAERKSP